MVLAIVTETPLHLHPVEHDPFIDPPVSDDMVSAHHAAADIGVAGTTNESIRANVSSVR